MNIFQIRKRPKKVNALQEILGNDKYIKKVERENKFITNTERSCLIRASNQLTASRAATKNQAVKIIDKTTSNLNKFIDEIKDLHNFDTLPSHTKSDEKNSNVNKFEDQIQEKKLKLKFDPETRQ